MGNQMSGRKPTDEEIADVRKILGAPRAKPKPDDRKTQARKRAKPAK
jgi:hypothetical protein